MMVTFNSHYLEILVLSFKQDSPLSRGNTIAAKTREAMGKQCQMMHIHMRVSSVFSEFDDKLYNNSG